MLSGPKILLIYLMYPFLRLFDYLGNLRAGSGRSRTRVREPVVMEVVDDYPDDGSSQHTENNSGRSTPMAQSISIDSTSGHVAASSISNV